MCGLPRRITVDLPGHSLVNLPPHFRNEYGKVNLSAKNPGGAAQRLAQEVKASALCGALLRCVPCDAAGLCLPFC